MARFLFLDTKARGPGFVMQAFGIAFPAGVAVEVTDPAVVAKLRGNRFWREEEEADTAEEAPKRRGRPRKNADG